MDFSFKAQKVITITKAFQEILDENRHNPNGIWVDKGNKFCNRIVKSWLQDNKKQMYSTHNQGKYVVAERFNV